MASVTMTIHIKNGRAVKALRDAIASVEQIASEQPWNDDAKRARKALRYVARNMTSRKESP